MTILELGGISSATIDVTDYDTFQEAIDASPQGARFRIPAGTYNQNTVPALDSMDLTGKSLIIEGDGVAGTYLQHYGSETQDLITLDGSDFTTIRGIRFEGLGVANSASWINWINASYCSIYDCWVDLFPSWCIDTTNADSDLVANRFTSVRFSRSKSNGCIALGNASTSRCFQWVFDRCLFGMDAGKMVDVSWSQKSTFRDCTFETNIDTGATGYDNAYVYSEGFTVGLIIDGCWFEDEANNVTPNNWFIFLKSGVSPAWSIRDCFFVRSGNSTSLRVFKSLGGIKSGVFENAYGSLSPAVIVSADDIVFAGPDYMTVGNTYLSYNGNNSAGEFSMPNADPATRVTSRRFKPLAVDLIGRGQLTNVTVGDTIFVTDDTAADLTTGVLETWSSAGGGTWKKAW